MSLVARILGVSLLMSALTAGLGVALLRPDRHSSDAVVVVFVAGVGGVIGSVAGAAREIVAAQRGEVPARPGPAVQRSGISGGRSRLSTGRWLE